MGIVEDLKLVIPSIDHLNARLLLGGGGEYLPFIEGEGNESRPQRGDDERKKVKNTCVFEWSFL